MAHIEVELFKSKERKLVVLRKLNAEESCVRDFDACIIDGDEYDSVYKELGLISRRIEKNYREYLSEHKEKGKRLFVELDSLVYVGDFYLTFSQWSDFCAVWDQFEKGGEVYEKFRLGVSKSRRELRAYPWT